MLPAERTEDVIFFFFSSRRRHTRCGRDWSSDVCSSDLPPPRRAVAMPRIATARRGGGGRPRGAGRRAGEVGRASCRERGEISGGAGSLKKKKQGTEGKVCERKRQWRVNGTTGSREAAD